MQPPRSDDAETLATLRARIDEIDASMQQLLQQRAEVIDALVAAKKTATGAAFRPDREAAMMQRLRERHAGNLPFVAIAHIWRVIISTFTQLQAPFDVHIVAGDDALRDTARYQFSFSSPLREWPDRDAALAQIDGASKDLALVPPGGSGDWWSAAIARGAQVIAALPEIETGLPPALVFAAGSVDVSELPCVVISLNGNYGAAFAAFEPGDAALSLAGSGADGAALFAVRRAQAEDFVRRAEAAGLTVTPAGGIAAPEAMLDATQVLA
ncbi:chorismate mutase [Tepidamorphus sp. 3E244]|uniref:chorismate mutase n=1 Tax=Tepidamorphus sp. 3E244 TaxID=3385498 RepID=UPI0038FC7C42